MKVWLYYAKAGGGHKAPAEAVAREFNNLFPETETKLIDMAEEAAFLFKYTIDSGYVILTHHAQWIYAALFTLNKIRAVIAIEYWLSKLFLKNSMKARLVVDRPQVIVATHFLVSPLRAALKELNLHIPIIVLVTDPFSVSPVWFYYSDLNYIVFSEAAKKIAIKCGISEEKIHRLDQIVNHPVLTIGSEEKNKILSEHGLDPSKKTILVIGGGNGLPEGEKIVAEIIKKGTDANIAIVCGTNKFQAEEMKKVCGEENNKCRIFGWVERFNRLIAVSDLVVTKAGAGVVWESILNRKKILITHYIFGQEKGTVDFVDQNNFGKYVPEPKKAAAFIDSYVRGEAGIFGEPKLDPKEGNAEVANLIMRLAGELRP